MAHKEVNVPLKHL